MLKKARNRCKHSCTVPWCPYLVHLPSLNIVGTENIVLLTLHEFCFGFSTKLSDEKYFVVRSYFRWYFSHSRMRRSAAWYFNDTIGILFYFPGNMHSI